MMMRRVAAAMVPPWLETMLTTPFFSACPAHADAARSECNMFCVDCAAGSRHPAFCFYCRSDRHPGHRVIQIRRSSYHDVVRVAEVQTVLDISGVQTYVINSARVLFLNERPQPRGGGGKGASPHACEICSRALLDPFRFCSLGCKLAGIKRNGDAYFMLGAAADEGEEKGGRGESVEGGKVGRSEGLRELGAMASEGSGQDHRLPTPPPTSNSRRRKGIPRRSPLTS